MKNIARSATKKASLLRGHAFRKRLRPYFPKVNLAENPIAAGSKLMSVTKFNSGFQSREILIGMLANL